MRFLSFILALALLIFQTGCWNSREINALAFALSIALDKDDAGFKVTAQLAKPEVYSKSSSGGAGMTQQEKPFWLLSAKGKTIFEAIRNMAELSPRRVFWPHIKVIVLSEEMAKNNIAEVFDFFSRNPELRLRTKVAVTEGEAAKLLEVVPMMEKDPSEDIEKIIDKANLSGNGYGIMLKNFLEEYLDPYLDPVASKLTITNVNSKETIKLEGAAVFRNTAMVGWLNEDETRGLLWIKNKISESIRVVDCPFDGKPVSLEIKKGKTNIKSYITKEGAKFIISATADAKLTEQSCLTQFNNKQTINALEKTLASAISKDIGYTVIAAQKLDADILGFSHTLHKDHNKQWQQMSSKWPQYFENAKVEIQVKVRIPEISLLAKSMAPREMVEQNYR